MLAKKNKTTWPSILFDLSQLDLLLRTDKRVLPILIVNTEDLLNFPRCDKLVMLNFFPSRAKERMVHSVKIPLGRQGKAKYCVRLQNIPQFYTILFVPSERIALNFRIGLKTEEKWGVKVKKGRQNTSKNDTPRQEWEVVQLT